MKVDQTAWKEIGMRTMEPPREEIGTTRTTTHHPSRGWLLIAAIAVLALVAGGVIGWFVRGDDDPTVMLAGQGEMTARQEQMVEFLDDYAQAWNDADADALIDMYADDGRFVALGRIYPVDDPLFTDFVEMNWTIEHLDGYLVHGDMLLSFHRTGQGQTLANAFTFTSTGELLIVEHKIME